MNNPLVIGGAAVDLKGLPLAALKPGASNLGVLRRSTGGVGLNIALNLAALGLQPAFISLAGNDGDGDFIVARCRAAGLDTARVARVDDEATAVFSAIIDEKGGLVAGISAMAIFERLTPAFLEPHRELIAAAPLVVMDANAPEETVAWVSALARERGVPLWLEPTAFDTCGRIRRHLAGATWVSPNVEELEALAGRRAGSPRDRLEAARQLLAMGVREVFVTCGDDGVLHVAADAESAVPAPVVSATDATGAGDAFVAGTVAGLLAGLATPAALRRGMAAAHLTLQVPESVHPGLSPALLEQAVRACFP